MADLKRKGVLEFSQKGAKKAARDVQGLNKSVGGLGKSAKGADNATTAQAQTLKQKFTPALGMATKAMGALAIAYGAVKAGQQAMKWAEEAAKVRDLGSAFQGFASSAGTSHVTMMREMKDATAGTVAEVSLMRNANMAMMLDVPVDRFGDMMRIARNAALSTGQETEYMVQSLTVALARQSRLWLDNLGIIVDSDAAYAKYAASVGKAVSELSELERKQAFVNEALDLGLQNIEKSGGLLTGAADPFARLHASSTDLALALKDMLVPALSDVAGGIADISVETTGLLGDIREFHADASVAGFIKLVTRLSGLAAKLPGMPEVPGISVGDVRIGGLPGGMPRGGPAGTRAEWEEAQRRRYEWEMEQRRKTLMRMREEEPSIFGGVETPVSGGIPVQGALPEGELQAPPVEMVKTFSDFVDMTDDIGQLTGGIWAMGEAAEAAGELGAKGMSTFLDASIAALHGSKTSYAELGKVVLKWAADTLKSIAVQAASKALFYTAEGLAWMSLGNAKNSGEAFAAAKMYGLVALAAAPAAIAVGAVSAKNAPEGTHMSQAEREQTTGLAEPGSRTRNLHVTRTAPTTIHVTHNYFGEVNYRSQAVSDAAAIQEVIETGDIYIGEEVA